MPQHEFFAQGQWNFVCDECGRVFKSNHALMRWDNAMVCDTGSCWEPRQPQDFVRAVPDNQSTPWARPRAFVFLGEPIADSALGEVALGDAPALGGP